MTIETLVTTMHCDDYESLYRRMNIQGDAVIASQGDTMATAESIIDGHTVKYIATNARGVSLNRNTAIAASTGDILIIADDDVVYDDGCFDTIRRAYERFPRADMILFDVPSTNPERATFTLKQSKMCRFDEIVRFATFQCTIRRRVADGGVRFDERFGPGSKVYGDTSGEDTLFIAKTRQHGHKIAYVKERIGVVNHAESTWFSKKWSKPFFEGHGTLYAEISRPLAVPYILAYAVLTHKEFKHKTTFTAAVRDMLVGARKVKG
jgi:glycosyltransferase involved in cell wall biosynthesis